MFLLLIKERLEDCPIKSVPYFLVKILISEDKISFYNKDSVKMAIVKKGYVSETSCIQPPKLATAYDIPCRDLSCYASPGEYCTLYTLTEMSF